MNSVSGKTHRIYFLPPSLIWYVFLSKANTHTHKNAKKKNYRVGKMLFRWFLFFCRSSDDVMGILFSVLSFGWNAIISKICHWSGFFNYQFFRLSSCCFCIIFKKETSCCSSSFSYLTLFSHTSLPSFSIPFHFVFVVFRCVNTIYMAWKK